MAEIKITQNDVELLFKVVAIIGGFLAAFKVIYEISEGRKQKVLELRWKKANVAKQMISELMSSEPALNATTMFDWTGREFEIAEDEFEAITFEDVRGALRTQDLSFSDKEVFIRDCVDGFLFQIEFLEQAIQNGLIDFEDVKFPTKYYYSVLKEHKIYDFLMLFAKQYEYSNSVNFFQRYESKNVQL